MDRCREAEVQAEAAERNAQKLQKEVDLLEVRVVTFKLVKSENTHAWKVCLLYNIVIL